ncbi:TraB/GumN family protein [Hydrogenophaga crocea]|uniref:TraB/GumN family protein n=1 Tax=Hydrogenophaga crocea TaxID=2716225 RepID=A0A6G8IJG3_9BURK|nr:TraB/GumN family protein [Hydrogenophaga crocea]QIM53347.1 TraB/GumN family protein [Hydrogenophaga crocea]
MLTRLLRGLLALAIAGPLAAQTPTPALSPPTPAPAACPPQAQVPGPQQLQAAQAQARDRGALWRLEREGRTSWLYGTLHVGKLEWAFPGPQVLQALRSSDSVALELDVSDPALAQQLRDGLAGPAPTPPAALQQRLDRQIAAACVPAAAFAALHPLQQGMALLLLDARWIGLDPGYGVEHVLAGFAKSSRRPLIALETARQQLQALAPATPEEALRALDGTLTLLESGRSREVLARLAQAWADGDLDTVARYESWCDCATTDDDRAALRRLNDGRNPHLADRIAALHGEGRRLFAAVGLLHMTGEQALPRLLAERGFRVARVPLQ